MLAQLMSNFTQSWRVGFKSARSSRANKSEEPVITMLNPLPPARLKLSKNQISTQFSGVESAQQMQDYNIDNTFVARNQGNLSPSLPDMLPETLVDASMLDYIDADHLTVGVRFDEKTLDDVLALEAGDTIKSLQAPVKIKKIRKSSRKRIKQMAPPELSDKQKRILFVMVSKDCNTRATVKNWVKYGLKDAGRTLEEDLSFLAAHGFIQQETQARGKNNQLIQNPLSILEHGRDYVQNLYPELNGKQQEVER